MLSVLLLLGLIPAGLLMAGDGDTNDSSDEDDSDRGRAESGSGATTPLDQVLTDVPPSGPSAPSSDAASPPPAWPSDSAPAGAAAPSGAPGSPDQTAPQNTSTPADDPAPTGGSPDASTPSDGSLALDPLSADHPSSPGQTTAPTTPDRDQPLFVDDGIDPTRPADTSDAPLLPADHDAATGAPADSTDPEQDGDDTGRDLILDPEDGDTTISDFRPGADVLDIKIDDPEVIGFRSLDPQTGDAQLRLFGLDGEQVITFAGLGQVPSDDIFLLLTDPDSGEAMRLALAEFLFDENEALDPITPDEPSIITPPEDENGAPGLDPIPAETPPVSSEASPSAVLSQGASADDPPAGQTEALVQPSEAVTDSLLIETQAATTPTRAA